MGKSVSSNYDHSPGWDANSYHGSPDGSFEKADYWSSQKRSRHGSPTSELINPEMYNAKIIDITDSKRIVPLEPLLTYPKTSTLVRSKSRQSTSKVPTQTQETTRTTKTTTTN